MTEKIITIIILYVTAGGIFGWWYSFTQTGKTGQDPWWIWLLSPAMWIVISPILLPIMLIHIINDWRKK